MRLKYDKHKKQDTLREPQYREARAQYYSVAPTGGGVRVGPKLVTVNPRRAAAMRARRLTNMVAK